MEIVCAEIWNITIPSDVLGQCSHCGCLVRLVPKARELIASGTKTFCVNCDEADQKVSNG